MRQQPARAGPETSVQIQHPAAGESSLRQALSSPKELSSMTSMI